MRFFFYLGTPKSAYDSQGNKVWSCELDIYGKIKHLEGDAYFIPFRYQGQYHDTEIDLYYNRFRYYSPETGGYISQDPIRLESGNFNIYSYVHNSTIEIDPLGLVLGKNMPSNGWNYGNMPKIDDYQLHHVIPKSKASQAAGFDVNQPSNLIYLPRQQGTHPERSLHNGWNRQHSAYNISIGAELDEIHRIGRANNWSSQQYHDAVSALSTDTRQGLRKGNIRCN